MKRPSYCLKNARRLLIILLFCQGWGAFYPSFGQSDFWTRQLGTLPQKTDYTPGSFRFAEYLPLLEGKRVALVVNHTAGFNGVHLVDTLQALRVNLVKIFAPEHGFRGTHAAGEWVASDVDKKSGLPLVSLYGKNKKPAKEMLEEVDVVLFDIQDVGVRFYTYISTMKLVMQACAENGKQFILCDRFNPLGYCTGGPVLQRKYMSFVGAFPIPVVHGLTVGELAQMAIAKNWLTGAKKLKIKIIPCLGYRHSDRLFPEVPPSPNLTTPLSILAYPSLGLFEGTSWSVGRGTDFPFQVFGYPDSSMGNFRFVPARTDSHQMKPLFEGKTCFGSRLNKDSIQSCFSLRFINQAWNKSGQNPAFFNSFFKKLAGNEKVESYIRRGVHVEFSQIGWLRSRRKFLLYEE